MTSQELSALSDEALLQQAKKMRSSNIFDAAFIGFLIGIAVYSIVKHGFGLLTFIPLVYIPIAAKNNIKYKALQQVLKERGLK